MELSQLTSASLNNLIRLAEEKQILLARIAKLDASMQSLVAGKTPAAAPSAPSAVAKPAPKSKPAKAAPPVAKAPAPAPARAKRGALKEGILAALDGAGPDGLTIAELSTQLAAAPANIHVWFSTTGKKLSAISRIGAGRYALAALPATLIAPAIIEPTVIEPAVIESTFIEPEAPAPAPVEAAAVEPAAETPSEPPVESLVEALSPPPIADEPTEAEPAAEIVEPTTTIVPVEEDTPAPKDEEFLLASH